MKIKTVHTIPAGCHLMNKRQAIEFAAAGQSDGATAQIYFGKVPKSDYYSQKDRQRGLAVYAVKLT